MIICACFSTQPGWLQYYPTILLFWLCRVWREGWDIVGLWIFTMTPCWVLFVACVCAFSRLMVVLVWIFWKSKMLLLASMCLDVCLLELRSLPKDPWAMNGITSTACNRRTIPPLSEAVWKPLFGITSYYVFNTPPYCSYSQGREKSHCSVSVKIRRWSDLDLLRYGHSQCVCIFSLSSFFILPSHRLHADIMSLSREKWRENTNVHDSPWFQVFWRSPAHLATLDLRS